MGQNRLNGLADSSIHSETFIEAEEVIYLDLFFTPLFSSLLLLLFHILLREVLELQHKISAFF